MEELLSDGDQQAAFAAGVVGGMAQIGQIKERNAEKLEDSVMGGGLRRCSRSMAREMQLPVGLGQAAVGHGAVDDAVVALAGLEEDASGEQKRIGGGVDDGAAGVRTPCEPLTW